MVQLFINDEYVVLGDMSVKQYKIQNGNTETVVVEGLLQINQYIPDIKTIATNSMYIDGVDVNSESFGTAESMIIYGFTATSIGLDIDLFNEQLQEIYKNNNEEDQDNE